MGNLNKICNGINSDKQKIIGNIQQESIDVYNFIQNEFKKGSISENTIFQFAFRSFYRMDSAGLVDEFKKRFFEIFEKQTTFEYEKMKSVLLELYEIQNFKNQNTIQFSFITKMFHTIDNSIPIYDNEVITVFGFRQPYDIHDNTKRIDQYFKQHREIHISYKEILSNNYLSDTIQLFNDKFKNHNLNKIMVLDFIFWSFGKILNKK